MATTPTGLDSGHSTDTRPLKPQFSPISPTASTPSGAYLASSSHTETPDQPVSAIPQAGTPPRKPRPTRHCRVPAQQNTSSPAPRPAPDTLHSARKGKSAGRRVFGWNGSVRGGTGLSDAPPIRLSWGGRKRPQGLLPGPVESRSALRCHRATVSESARLRAPQASSPCARLAQVPLTNGAPRQVSFRTETSGNTCRLITPHDPPRTRFPREQLQPRARGSLLNKVVRLDGFPRVLAPTSRDHIRHPPSRWQRPQAPSDPEQQQLTGVPKVEANPRTVRFPIQPCLQPSDVRDVSKTPVGHHF